jgi:hypothetical protein
MIINEKLGFIYIHIPKTGGNSILRPLFESDCPEGNVVYNDMLVEDNGISMYPWNFNHGHGAIERNTIVDSDYFSFAFVRNPWDRLVSLYHWRFRVAHLSHEDVSKITFKEFVICLRDGSLESPGHFNMLAWPQSHWTHDGEGCPLDFIGRLENIERDFAHVCDVLDIDIIKPRILNKNRSRKCDDYRTYYDDESIAIASDLYHQDIANFGYSFG